MLQTRSFITHTLLRCMLSGELQNQKDAAGEPFPGRHPVKASKQNIRIAQKRNQGIRCGLHRRSDSDPRHDVRHRN